MNEVEKMYENAGVKPLGNTDLREMKILVDGKVFVEGKDLPNNYYNIYPPFTAKKQLELIKWLSTKELKIRTNKQPYAVYVGVLGNDNTCFYGCEGLYLEQTLSELINHLWQDLTEEERKQIKNILE